MPLPTAPNEAIADTVGPINALEADRYVEELRSFEFQHFGDARWMNQHEFLTKLNMQAHVNASQQRDEFVLEAVVLHEKMPLLIRELIATELWKSNAYPLIKDWLEKNNSIKGYLLLYNEGVLANLLEALLYHKEGCEAAGDLIVELVDYCYRKLTYLMGVTPPSYPADKEELKKKLLKEADETDSTATQVDSINMQCAICCLSIVRFLTDHIDALPLAVTARILDTYDMLMVLCPLLEVKPWQTDGADGEHRRFLQGHWSKVSEADARKLSKAEAQCWLAVYNLVLTPSVRRRYQFNSYRKNCLLRVRKFLHETTVDQIPILVDLMRALDEMLMQDPPSAAEIKPAYLLEQLPELRDSLCKDVDWKKVVETQKADALNDTEEEKRMQAMTLAGVFDLDGMDELLSAESAAASNLQKEMVYYVQITVCGDEDGNADKEYVRVLAESEDDALAPQSAFIIPTEAKQLLIPNQCKGHATVTASLTLGTGSAQQFECKGTLELVEGRKKQWLQLGFDPYGLRVQLHILAAADGSGYHIIHARVTPPPPCLLTLTFVGKKQGETLQIRAKGRGVQAQAPYEVDAIDAQIRVPKLSSASAKLVVNVGAGVEIEEVAEAASTDLALSSASQMVWRQLGADASTLRVQLKLAPAEGGGFALTAVRVTPPSSFRNAEAVASASARAAAAAAKTAAAQSEADQQRVAAPEPTPAPAPASAPPAPTSSSLDDIDDADEPRIVEACANMKSAADALFAKGDATGAALVYTELLAKMPPSTQLGHTALSNRSACHLAQREWSLCASDCDEALKAARSDLPGRAKVKLHLRRAEARLNLGLRELANADVREAEHLREHGDTTAEAHIGAIKAKLAATPAAAVQQEIANKANPGSKVKATAAPPVEVSAPRAGEAAAEAKPKVEVAVVGEAPSRSLTLNVSLPGVRTLADIALEISNTSVHVHGAGYALDEALPFAVDSSSASAKFSSKASMLRVKATEAC